MICPGRGQIGLGFFVIHVEGCAYGISKPDATLLACSFDAVVERLEKKGTHVAPFSNYPDGELIAQACYDMNYGDGCDADEVLGIPGSDFRDVLTQNQIQWAPDGDQAFDDGSYILQFDSDSRVRLIGFMVDENRVVDRASLKDCWLDADDYYAVLLSWSSALFAKWQAGIEVSEGPGFAL